MARDPYAPRWSDAPAWANWHAIDASGVCTWFADAPHTDANWWMNDVGCDAPFDSYTYADDGCVEWRFTLRERPSHARKEKATSNQTQLFEEACK